VKQIETIERDFIYRVSRAIPITLALGATAIIVFAMLLVVKTVVPPKRPAEPQPAVEPALVAVTADEIAAEVDRRAASERSRDAGTSTSDDSRPPSQGAQDVATAVHAIRQLLPARQYAWQNEYRTVCRERLYGYCLGERRVLSRSGVATHLVAVMDLYDAPGSDAELVELVDPSMEYTVNGSNAALKVSALEVARAALEPLEVGERGRYLEAWSGLWQARERERGDAYANELDRVRREREREQARYAAAEEKRQRERRNGLIAIGAGLTGIWMFGMTLALLAIERNTRHPSGTNALRVIRPPVKEEPTETTV
jgi:hypothetical protein